MAMKAGWEPSYPSYSARFDSQRSVLTILILGVQFADITEDRAAASSYAQEFMTLTAEADDVEFRDQSEFVDDAGQCNRMIVCYLAEHADATVEGLRQQWLAGPEPTGSIDGHGRLGFFVEEIKPTMDRVETLYSSDHIQGVANVAETLSPQIQEHAYWGSARDRLPAAQQDRLAPSGGTTSEDDGNVIVSGIENLCLIRSGQDWSETAGDERAMYLGEVEPTLRAGMDYLTASGGEVGCIANRYARALDEDGNVIDQSYGMSWWYSMASLDDWARVHPTHKAIFGVAMRYLGEHGGSGHLKLTHEVFVTERAQGHFVYRNCHPATGLLGIGDQSGGGAGVHGSAE